MTEIALNTKQKPIIGNMSSIPNTHADAPIYPPRHSDPTSPMNMDAFEVLNIKNPSIAPANSMDNTFMF